MPPEVISGGTRPLARRRRDNDGSAFLFHLKTQTSIVKLVAGAGFEPAAFGL